MKNEYIIVNKTTIEERIAKLENIASAYSTIKELKQILSQSTPLIPEIEKAYNTGTNYGCYLQGGSYDHNDNIDIEDYISNLKLDI